jgi:hypothetical protein
MVGVDAFGSAQSFRKLHGCERAKEGLPSLHEQHRRLAGGTVELDASRQQELAMLLVERTGQNVATLWQTISAGAARIDARSLPERLAVAGVGTLGPRELGLLQRSLPPSPDGSIGSDQWLRAFGAAAQCESPPPAGRTTSHFMAHGELPHMRIDNAMPGAAPMPNLLPRATPPTPAASELWPGGHTARDEASDLATRRAEAHTPSIRPPFGVQPDEFAHQSPRAPMAASPTFAATAHDPPFATYASVDAHAATPRARSVRTEASVAPFATADNAPPAPTAMCVTPRVTTPYASGGAWSSN